MAPKATAWVAVVIPLSLLAAWVVSGNPTTSWAEFARAPSDRRPSEMPRSGYPVSMELPKPVRAERAPFNGSSPDRQSSLTERGETSDARLGQPAAEAPRTQAPAAGGRLLVPVDFNVADFGTSAALEESGRVRTTKPVVIAGNRIGVIELMVGRGASVSVDRRALAALVGDKAPELTAALSRTEGELVTLDALRNRQVAIRYDPLTDTLVIESRS